MSRRKSKNLDARAAVLDYLNEVGNMAAAKAAVEVCQDPKAAPQARATASTSIFRATGFGGFARTFTPPEAENPEDAIAALSVSELDRLLDQTRQEIRDLEAIAATVEHDDSEDEGGPFD